MAVRIPAEKQDLAEDTWTGAEIGWKIKVVG